MLEMLLCIKNVDLCNAPGLAILNIEYVIKICKDMLILPVNYLLSLFCI